MRETEYRAWNIEKEIMLQWTDILKNRELFFSIFYDEKYMTDTPIPIWQKMQYTGLKDKKGVKIFENSELNGKYIIFFSVYRYVLYDILNDDIIMLQRYLQDEAHNDENPFEITKEYAQVSTDTQGRADKYV